MVTKAPWIFRLARNLSSAYRHPDRVDAELSKECAKGHIAGPYLNPPLSTLQDAHSKMVLNLYGEAFCRSSGRHCAIQAINPRFLIPTSSEKARLLQLLQLACGKRTSSS